MSYYYIHAGLYLLAKEFRYITILRNNTVIYHRLYKNIYILFFILMALDNNQIIYLLC